MLKNNLTNQQFGKLTVLKKAGKTKRKRQKWLCQCECGRKTSATHGHLTSGNRKTCGYCRSYPIKQNCIVKIYGDTKRNASRRKTKELEFKLTLQDIEDIIFQNCHYCNTSPSHIFSRKTIAQKVPETICWNGIDRINSDMGYIKENCVTCCKYCNWIKSDKTVEEMVQHIEKIYNYFIKNNKKA